MGTISVQSINGPYEPSSDTTPLSTLVWTAASTGADTIVIPSGRVLLLFRNSGASARTITIASNYDCLLYTSPSPRDRTRSRMPSSA